MSDGLFGLPIHWTSAWIFNCYVLGDAGEDLLIVDPGLPMVAVQALDLVRNELGRPSADIQGVMCTHGHSDHVGGVSTVLESAAADVHLPAKCRDYLDGERPRNFGILEASLRFMPVYQEQPFSVAALRQFASGGRSVGYGGRPDFHIDFEASHFLKDASPVAGFAGWEAVHAPGHTDDSTCLYHRDSATLLSGDAVVTQDGVAWFNPEWVDLDVSRRTEERLRSLEVRHLLPGHGRPVEARDVWSTARSSTEKPSGSRFLARCSRRFGTW